MLHRIVPKYKGPAEICFPGFEHGPEIDEENIICFYNAVGRVLRLRFQRVGPAPDDAFVPVGFDAEAVGCQLVDFVAQLLLTYARTNELVFDFLEEAPCFVLGIL